MQSSINRKVFKKNLVYAFVAQGTSLLFSIIMSLLVPKFLGVTEYSYWQLYLFYTSYTGFFHFGLNDGVYLRLGGQSYNALDRPLLNGQLLFLGAAQVILGILFIFGNCFVPTNAERFAVFTAVSLYCIMFNVAGYIGFIFQATNRTNIYSVSVVIDKLLFLLNVVLLLAVGTRHFVVFVVFHLFCKLISTSYLMYQGRDILKSGIGRLDELFREVRINISVGIKLTIATIASQLILGSGRLILDHVWGIETFGRLSFSLSLTNFFLQFINQVSMVLFPALREVNEEQQNSVYLLTSSVLSLFLPVVLLGYFPAQWILGLWLPAYQESIRYLILLLPICVFDAKMQMLCNTYFKVLRKEKLLLSINLVSMLFSVVLCAAGGYILHSVELVAVAMVVSIAFRSILSELFLSGMMKCSVGKEMVQEVLLTAIFIVSAWFMSLVQAVILYLLAYAIYLVVHRQSIKRVMSFLFGREKSCF